MHDLLEIKIQWLIHSDCWNIQIIKNGVNQNGNENLDEE